VRGRRGCRLAGAGGLRDGKTFGRQHFEDGEHVTRVISVRLASFEFLHVTDG
jgi:hypothetical protein